MTMNLCVAYKAMRFYQSSRLPGLHLQNPPKTFRMFREVPRHTWLGSELGMCLKPHVISFRRIDDASQTPAQVITKIVHDSADGHINNDARCSLTNF